jgi:hypothetical protein
LKGSPEKDSSVEADPLENEISQVEQQTENVVEVSEAEEAMPQRSKRVPGIPSGQHLIIWYHISSQNVSSFGISMLRGREGRRFFISVLV